MSKPKGSPKMLRSKDQPSFAAAAENMNVDEQRQGKKRPTFGGEVILKTPTGESIPTTARPRPSALKIASAYDQTSMMQREQNSNAPQPVSPANGANNNSRQSGNNNNNFNASLNLSHAFSSGSPTSPLRALSGSTATPHSIEAAAAKYQEHIEKMRSHSNVFRDELPSGVLANNAQTNNSGNNNNNGPGMAEFSPTTNDQVYQRVAVASAAAAKKPAHQEISDRRSAQSGSEHDPGSASTISGMSGSSAGSQGDTSGALQAFKKTKICGLSIAHLMIIVVMIAPIFLAVYSIIPVVEASVAVKYLEVHRPIMQQIFEAAAALALERDSSTFLTAIESRNFTVYPFPKATVTEFKDHVAKDLVSARFNAVDSLREAFRLTVDNSDGEFKETVLAVGNKLLKDISTVRTRFDARLISVGDLRDIYNGFIDSCAEMLLKTCLDQRLGNIHDQMILLAVLMRIENSVNAIMGAAASLLWRDDDTLIEHVKLLSDNYNNLLTFLIVFQTAEREFADIALSWNNSPLFVEKMKPAIVNYFNKINGNLTFRDWVVSNTWINETSWNPLAEILLPDVRVAATWYLDTISDSQILKETRNTELIKMLVAIFVCVVASAVVIHLNIKEQERMEGAYDATKTLTDAVRRFVPKNQLKMMGVRSVVEVSPGDNVEVAVCLTFSDIRSWTSVSEKMSNTELFFWLNNYFSRCSRIVTANHGYIDSMIGDAIFVVNNSALEGIHTAIALQVNADKLSLELVARGSEQVVAVGCGVHFGGVISGVFGDESRLTCTMISREVNSASRVEGLTKTFGAKILATEAVAERLPNINEFLWRCLGKVIVKGSNVPIELYDFYQTDPVELRDHKTQHREKFHQAMQLVETDPKAASEMFDRIYKSGIKQRKVEDLACQRRIEAVSVTPGEHVLSFEKDGALKTPASTPNLSKLNTTASSPVQMYHNNNNNNSRNARREASLPHQIVSTDALSENPNHQHFFNNNNNRNSTTQAFPGGVVDSLNDFEAH